MPYELKYPNTLDAVFNSVIENRLGVFFKNEVPIVKAYPDAFARITDKEYERYNKHRTIKNMQEIKGL